MNELSSVLFDDKRRHSPSHALAWALLLLRAMNHSGLSPSSNLVFHQVLYFGNTMARLYRIEALQHQVSRLPQGPYYPEAQRTLDRLVVQGLASISNLKFQSYDSTRLRLGIYDVTKEGAGRAQLLINGSDWAAEAYELLTDICTAFARLKNTEIIEVAGEDPIYNTLLGGEMYSFRDVENNLSSQLAVLLRDRLPESLKPSRQQTLRLFVRYLAADNEKKAA